VNKFQFRREEVKYRMLTLVALLTIVLSACGPAATPTPAATAPDATESPAADSPKTPQALQPTPVAEALFVVVKADGSSRGFTWDALKALPLANIQVKGKVEEGPKLMDILAAAGVTDFTAVTLTGSNGSITLPREQVDDQTILDFTNRGTVKLASTYVPKDDWIKDITRIEVK
jgi:hypothetical protein